MYTPNNKNGSFGRIAPYIAVAVAAFGVWKYLESTTVVSANDSQNIKYNTATITDHEGRIRDQENRVKETEKAILGIETSINNIDRTQVRILNKLDHVAQPINN